MTWQELMPWAYTWVTVVTIAVVLLLVAIGAVLFGWVTSRD